jgi:CheY-like chemotaxis protein
VRTILVVDDEAVHRESIARTLRAEGHEVIEAIDGREGLDQYHLHRPALVLCDILMPERDGLEMIGALRASYPEVPIVAMLAVDDFEAALLLDIAKALGANATVLKPLSSTRLIETVSSLLAPPVRH